MRDTVPHETSVVFFEHHPVHYIHPDRTVEWINDLPPEVSSQLLKCGRLFGRLSNQIKQHYRLDSLGGVAYEDLRIAMLERDKLELIAGISGAVYNGNKLRVLITKAAIVEILQDIHRDAYKIAVTHSDLVPSEEMGADKIVALRKEVILSDGMQCFRGWLKSLPKAASTRVELKFPPGQEDEPVPEDYERYGPVIVRAVAKELYFNDGQ